MKKLLLLFFISTFGFSQQPTPGTITDSIQIKYNRGSYALYVPSYYSAEKKWPIIMLFDPSGRGAMAVNRFKEASEKYGFIVACSNNVKNGTYQESLNIARAFYEDVIENHSVDTNALFLGGFSGGARLASAIAVISNKIKGVIVCGASFANTDNFMPKENDFMYVGLVGDEDFNYREMQSAKVYLDKLKFDSELIVFPGGHTWPSEQYVNKAVRTLALKAMTRNVLPKNETKIAEFFAEDLAYNKSLVQLGESYKAYNDLDELKQDYRFYVENDTLKTLQKEVKNTKEFRTQRASMYEIDQVEPSFYSDYLNYLPQDVASGELESLGYWEKEIKTIKKDYVNATVIEKQKMGKRLLNFLDIISTELGTSYDEKLQIDNLLYINIFKTFITPENPDPYLKILKFTVQKGEYGMALFYLEKLLDTGFKDTERLNAQEGISLLRIQPEYNEVLETYGLKTMY
ncbi:alpha/beta hydrolase [Joostella sp. CR20]|uniref:alpha/beta hydrolase n=1 Tax=Joostella sp. CR20 TaxID=2804312 RepID=UPI00313E5AFC